MDAAAYRISRSMQRNRADLYNRGQRIGWVARLARFAGFRRAVVTADGVTLPGLFAGALSAADVRALAGLGLDLYRAANVARLNDPRAFDFEQAGIRPVDRHAGNGLVEIARAVASTPAPRELAVALRLGDRLLSLVTAAWTFVARRFSDLQMIALACGGPTAAHPSWDAASLTLIEQVAFLIDQRGGLP